MEDAIVNANVAVELLEILRYVDSSIRKKIPYQLEETLSRIQNEQYHFKIDKTKSLKEQNIMKETKEVLSIMYLKYCCSKEEANQIIKENNEKYSNQEEIYEKYNPTIIFENKTIMPSEEIKKQNENNKPMLQENLPWYKKIIQAIKNFFKR